MIAPDPILPEPIVPNAITAEVIVPGVVSPQVIAPQVLTADVIAPDRILPQAIVPEVIPPQVVAPDVIAPALLVADVIPVQPVAPQPITPLPIAPGGSTDGSRSVEGASATATTGSRTKQAWRPGWDAGSVLQGRYTTNGPSAPFSPSHPGRNTFELRDPVPASRDGPITGLHHRLPADVPPGQKCLRSLGDSKHIELTRPFMPDPIVAQPIKPSHTAIGGRNAPAP